MSDADAVTPAEACRASLVQVARAESFPMAEWLAVRPDGRTTQAAYADAARLAWELDRRLGGPEADAPVESPPGTQPRERERRPVLVLTRELRECLTRVAERMETLPAGQTDATSVEGDLARLAGLLAPVAPTPHPSPPAGGRGASSIRLLRVVLRYVRRGGK